MLFLLWVVISFSCSGVGVSAHAKSGLRGLLQADGTESLHRCNTDEVDARLWNSLTGRERAVRNAKVAHQKIIVEKTQHQRSRRNDDNGGGNGGGSNGNGGNNGNGNGNGGNSGNNDGNGGNRGNNGNGNGRRVLQETPQARTEKIIPIWFHVVYANNAQNVPDAWLTEAVVVLNRDFSAANPNIKNPPPAGHAAVPFDTPIQFVWQTSWQTRKQTTTASWSTDDAVKFFSPRTGDKLKYFNVWVCNLGGGLLGYAQFPGGPAATDGVVMLYSSLPGGSSAPYNKGQTLTHEIGHSLNLRHIWGDGGCGVDDGISDTPVAGAANYGCPAPTQDSCPNEAGYDQAENFMDYTDDGCMYMFTSQQSVRMFALFAPGGLRETEYLDVNIPCSSSTCSGDGVFCNGNEVCVNSVCTHTGNPCSAGTTCQEMAGICAVPNLKVTIKTDNYPAETTWTLRVGSNTGTLVTNGGPYTASATEYTQLVYVTVGTTYVFTNKDSYGDGICCAFGSGSYKIEDIRVSASPVVLASGGQFTSSEDKTIILGSTCTCPNDNLFCNGQESCSGSGQCVSSGNPCSGTTPYCHEASDTCRQCLSNSNCANDGLYCNGVETCSNSGVCSSGGSPCLAPTPICVEQTDSCRRCLVNSHCSGSTPFCNVNSDQCVQCLVNTDCVNDNLYCNGAETCSSGVCGHAGNPCSGTTKPFCDEASDVCRQCLQNSHCTSGQTCVSGTCQAPPPPSSTLAVLTLVTDNYPEETSWDLTANGATVASRAAGYYKSKLFTYKEWVELPLQRDVQYTFTISDTYGDGICCVEGHGNYAVEELQLSGISYLPPRVLFGGGGFRYSARHNFTIRCGNGKCDSGETVCGIPLAVAGNGVCEPGEDCRTTPQDCFASLSSNICCKAEADGICSSPSRPSRCTNCGLPQPSRCCLPDCTIG
eukprot:gb/GEZN01001549.1/.p1 GENE.gb/GEZN01001549.1/~~gb/GEZN01001549.1/.p1  ORF type:complete len:930 (+),score=31.81 gb/GEZN01001549.1/:84-2873(+)